MTQRQIEQHLTDLGEATKPPATLAHDVMRRIEASAGCGGGTDAVRYAPRARRLGYRVAAVVALAAGIAAGVVVTTFRHTAGPQPEVVISLPPPAAKPANPSPSLADYRRALVQSPEALDALLQQRPEDGRPNPRTHVELRAGDVSWIILDSY
jgi:hypothetical protein